MTLLTDAFATFRITRLLTTDRITRQFRNTVERRYGTQGPGYLVGCSWCMSIYIGTAVVLARRVAPKAWSPVAEALAFSAITGLAAEHL